MNLVRGLTVGLMVTALLTITTLAQPAPASAADPDLELTATLDGKPIPLEDVSKYSCDDFSYPEIECWSTKAVQDARATLVTALTSIDYVTIYDLVSYNGASMNVSQDYTTLATIGWNDKISSFRARNNETGTFWTDWFYTGSWFSFCCNTSVANLGSWSNIFSSMQRT